MVHIRQIKKKTNLTIVHKTVEREREFNVRSVHHIILVIPSVL